MSDNIHRVRLPQELANEVNDIIEVINREVPGANASFSSVARIALQDYAVKFRQRWKEHFPNEGIVLNGDEPWLDEEDKDEE